MKKKPTLLVLASTYPRWNQDIEPNFVHELSRRLTPRFEVIALAPDAPGADPSSLMDGVRVVRFRYAPRKLQTLVNNGGIAVNLRLFPWKWLLVPSFMLAQFIIACRIVRKHKVDLIHVHWLLPQGLIAWLVHIFTGLPYVVTSHGGDLFGFRGSIATCLKKVVANNSAAMTVVSNSMHDEVEHLNFHPPSLHVLPMGVDLQERFVPDPDQTRSSDFLLFVGRLVEKKGLPHLLQAIPEVLRARPDVVLHIAGFGPEENRLRLLANRLGIEHAVQFLGPVTQDELPTLYRQAALFVAPFIRDNTGNQEGLPVVLMEAIGCGCPVVVGNVAGVSDLLGDATIAVSVQPEDTAALAAAILAALNDHHHAIEMAAKMRSAAMKSVDWQYIADGYANLLGHHCIEREK